MATVFLLYGNFTLSTPSFPSEFSDKERKMKRKERATWRERERGKRKEREFEFDAPGRILATWIPVIHGKYQKREEKREREKDERG